MATRNLKKLQLHRSLKNRKAILANGAFPNDGQLLDAENFMQDSEVFDSPVAHSISHTPQYHYAKASEQHKSFFT